MPKEVTVRRSFTVPQNIIEQVMARARLNRRSVNQEFVTLVEAGIDASVKSDLAIIAALTPVKPSMRIEGIEKDGIQIALLGADSSHPE